MFWQITYVGYTLVQYSSLTTFCIFHYSSSCFSADMLYILQVNHNISEAKEVFVDGIKQAPCKALIKVCCVMNIVLVLSKQRDSTSIMLFILLLNGALLMYFYSHQGFMQFMSTHGGPTEIPILDSVISNAVVPGSDISTVLSREDREDISLLFLEVREF